ncbi:response regulator [Mucilaginibacter conchicola]|uniref:Response regulator n=1 Tax=Mucilaginibacter conchicola TaxID=2303333 RepID=A0A372NQV8_9SPHI|nr:response regulator [Mucilaginibacter conchicola]RFZ91312.1 response regulator [Mucilaginibacter conchicola]
MKRILVIDDDEDLLEIFSLIFKDAGYNIVTSNHSETAQQIVEIGPDLVILDIRIAGSPQNGGEICSAIKQKFRDAPIPVLLISGETNISDIAFGCGADGFIKKPFDIDSLLTEIKHYFK